VIEIWNVLHDAIIVRLDGSVPGELRLEIDCDYLRDRFTPGGERFILTLSECTRFAFRPWSEPSSEMTDLGAIAARRLWVLSAEEVDGHGKVHCNEHIPKGNGGELLVSASACALRLDDGTPVTLSELKRVASEYWEEFSSSAGHEQ
jgi:hypothetical protein